MSEIAFDHSYSRLPDEFFIRTMPTPVASPRLIKLNLDLVFQLGLDDRWLSSAEGIGMLAGNNVPHGANPIATPYAGHQFGHFVPRLGDGRAILLGEVIDRDGIRRDIQLKGAAGRTPFSRGGDGRAALGPVLREYILSEAMNALRIPTTRALAAVLTGDTVAREMSLPGAIITRVASSHIRIGTFQFFAARGDIEGVRALADHVIGRHYPEAAAGDMPYLPLLAAVIGAQASLVAQWMLAGFIHGVMNTDNMSIAGETIDYGPCAFLDNYDPATVFSSIDHAGRYAYGNQAPVALWNLARLAETMLPLLADEQDKAVSLAQNALATFDAQFQTVFITGMRRKLGLFTEEENDLTLIKELLDTMTKSQADFTLTFRYLSHSAETINDDEKVLNLFTEPGAFREWLARWRSRISREPQTGFERRTAMLHVNPLFIPRNHRVEAVIAAAVQNNNFRPFEELLTVLGEPFEDQAEFAHYAKPPEIHERVFETFCGT